MRFPILLVLGGCEVWESRDDIVFDDEGALCFEDEEIQPGLVALESGEWSTVMIVPPSIDHCDTRMLMSTCRGRRTAPFEMTFTSHVVLRPTSDQVGCDRPFDGWCGFSEEFEAGPWRFIHGETTLEVDIPGTGPSCSTDF